MGIDLAGPIPARSQHKVGSILVNYYKYGAEYSLHKSDLGLLKMLIGLHCQE